MDRRRRGCGLWQQVALDLAGEIEFALHPFLFDERGGHVGVVHGQGDHAGQRLQEIAVGVGKEAARRVEFRPRLAFVDGLQGAQEFPFDDQRRAKNGAGAKAGLPVDAGAEIRVACRVAHQLDAAFRQGPADDALLALDAQAGDVDGAGAGAADEFSAWLVEQEQRGGLGIHVGQRLVDGVGQRAVEVGRAGEILAQLGKQGQIGRAGH